MHIPPPPPPRASPFHFTMLVILQRWVGGRQLMHKSTFPKRVVVTQEIRFCRCCCVLVVAGIGNPSTTGCRREKNRENGIEMQMQMMHDHRNCKVRYLILGKSTISPFCPVQPCSNSTDWVIWKWTNNRGVQKPMSTSTSPLRSRHGGARRRRRGASKQVDRQSIPPSPSIYPRS